MNIENAGMPTDYEKTEELEHCSELMNAWEKDFVQSLQEQLGSGRVGRCLTAIQKDKLDVIYERAVLNNESYNSVNRG